MAMVRHWMLFKDPPDHGRLRREGGRSVREFELYAKAKTEEAGLVAEMGGIAEQERRNQRRAQIARSRARQPARILLGDVDGVHEDRRAFRVGGPHRPSQACDPSA